MKTVETGKIMLTRLLNGLGRAISLSALLLAAGSFWPMAAQAEVPVKFTYQGNLRQSGFLVNGQRSMVFRIYSSSTSDTELCPSLAYNVNVSTGVFRVTLEPAITDWQSGSLWLELEVENNRLSPREELTSSPYSINSIMLSGKRYTSAALEPVATAAGDLWYDTSLNVINFWNGTDWTPSSGAGVPHALTHSSAGTDPIVNLNASVITSGNLSGDRIGSVIVSTHIADGTLQTQDFAEDSVTKEKLSPSGCANGSILQLVGGHWVCIVTAGAPEFDPHSIWKGDLLQATTFYVSSGTVNDFNVNNSLKVMGTALLKGAPDQQGLSVEPTGNVAIGLTGAAARLEIRGADTQNYSLAVGTGTAHQMVVSTSGAVGIGTENPAAKLDVTGEENSGEYIAIFKSGTKPAAWLRNK